MGGLDAAETFAAEQKGLQACEEAGLLRRQGQELTLTPLGRILVRNVAMVFDPYLRKKKPGGDGQTFSKTV